MVESLKAYIGESARELVAWATGKGAQFALNLALALVIFAVGAIAIRIAANPPACWWSGPRGRGRSSR